MRLSSPDYTPWFSWETWRRCCLAKGQGRPALLAVGTRRSPRVVKCKISGVSVCRMTRGAGLGWLGLPELAVASHHDAGLWLCTTLLVLPRVAVVFCCTVGVFYCGWGFAPPFWSVVLHSCCWDFLGSGRSCFTVAQGLLAAPEAWSAKKPLTCSMASSPRASYNQLSQQFK